MNTVLYEAPTGYDSIAESLAFPLIMILFLSLVPQLMYNPEKTFRGKNSSAIKRIPRYTGFLLAGVFVSLGACFILHGQLEMYRKVIVPYAHGQYEIAEGYVQNFVPMPREGHSNEMFDINGVHFEYSDNNIIVGYHHTKVRGGVIRGNGQYLKVGYVYFNETYGNIIVYIEELAPPE